MAKTVKDYINDSRILEDPEMMEAPECVKEIHAIRLKLQDETEGMTPEEHADHVNKKAEKILAQWGITPRWYVNYPKEEIIPEHYQTDE